MIFGPASLLTWLSLASRIPPQWRWRRGGGINNISVSVSAMALKAAAKPPVQRIGENKPKHLAQLGGVISQCAAAWRRGGGVNAAAHQRNVSMKGEA
jgi:hypothetical protein